MKNPDTSVDLGVEASTDPFTVETDKNRLSTGQIISLTKQVGFDLATEKHWEEFLNDDSFAAYIEIENELVAFGRICHDGDAGIIYDMCVAPDHQFHGLGPIVLGVLLDQAEKAELRTVGLYAWKGNPGVDAFYQKYGFRHVDQEAKPDNYMEATINS